MKKSLKRVLVLLFAMLFLCTLSVPALAAEETGAAAAAADPNATKAVASAAVLGVVALVAAIAMGWAIVKSVDSIARQPEAESKIRTTMMLGLVFVETVVIYALVIAILIIFVL